MELKSDEERILLMKICYSQYPQVQGELQRSEDLALHAWACGPMWDKVMNGDWGIKYKPLLQRITSWYVRSGQAKKIWDMI